MWHFIYITMVGKFHQSVVTNIGAFHPFHKGLGDHNGHSPSFLILLSGSLGPVEPCLRSFGVMFLFMVMSEILLGISVHKGF